MVYSAFRLTITLIYSYSIHCISCPQGYVQCALEGGFCSGTGMIAYGNSTRYTYQEAPIGCNNDTFGNDPSSLPKECCRQDPEITGPLGLPGPIVGIISCGQTILSFFGFVDDIHFWKLTTDITYNITYTTCDTLFDTRTHVYNASNNIISLDDCPVLPTNSDQTKTGDDCNEEKCSAGENSNNEWFTMNNQEAGEYYVKIISYANDGFGAYQLQVLCSAPTTSPTNEPTLHPTLLPTINPTGIPSTTPTIQPTNNPTTGIPTTTPITHNPTVVPSNDPTLEPTLQPISKAPSSASISPTMAPTVKTAQPTWSPIMMSNTNFNTSINATDSGGDHDDDNAATSSSILGIDKYMVYIICSSLLVCCCLIIIIICYFKRPHDKETELHALRKKNELEMMHGHLTVANEFSSDVDNDQLQTLNKVRSHSGNDVVLDGDLIRNNTYNNNNNNPSLLNWKCLNCETVNDKTHVICAGCFIDKEKVIKKIRKGKQTKQINNNKVVHVEHIEDDDTDESDSEEIEQIQQTIQIQQQIWIQKQIEQQVQTKKDEEMKQKQIEEQRRQRERRQKLLESLPKPPPALLFDAQHTARMSNDPNGVPNLLNVDEQSEIDAYHEGVNDDEGINDDDMEEKPIAQHYQ